MFFLNPQIEDYNDDDFFDIKKTELNVKNEILKYVNGVVLGDENKSEKEIFEDFLKTNILYESLVNVFSFFDYKNKEEEKIVDSYINQLKDDYAKKYLPNKKNIKKANDRIKEVENDEVSYKSKWEILRLYLEGNYQDYRKEFSIYHIQKNVEKTFKLDFSNYFEEQEISDKELITEDLMKQHLEFQRVVFLFYTLDNIMVNEGGMNYLMKFDDATKSTKSKRESYSKLVLDNLYNGVQESNEGVINYIRDFHKLIKDVTLDRFMCFEDYYHWMNKIPDIQDFTNSNTEKSVIHKFEFSSKYNIYEKLILSYYIQKNIATLEKIETTLRRSLSSVNSFFLLDAKFFYNYDLDTTSTLEINFDKKTITDFLLYNEDIRSKISFYKDINLSNFIIDNYSVLKEWKNRIYELGFAELQGENTILIIDLLILISIAVEAKERDFFEEISFEDVYCTYEFSRFILFKHITGLTKKPYDYYLKICESYMKIELYVVTRMQELLQKYYNNVGGLTVELTNLRMCDDLNDDDYYEKNGEFWI